MIKNKIKRALAAALAIMLCVPAATAFANPVEEELTFTEKSVETYILDNEDPTSMTCLFRSDLPEMAYIPAEDYMDAIYTVDIKVEKVSDHVYKFTNENSSMTVDTEKETVTFENYDLFMLRNVELTEDEKQDYIVEENPVYSDPDKVNHTAEFDLGKYDFDITEKDGKVYFPISVLTNLLVSTYKTAVYTGEKLYIFPASQEDEYLDASTIYENFMRSDAMADQNYRELCFIMDNYYGCPERVEFGKLIQEKGFDKALDEYSDQSRKAKELLKKKDNTDFILGLNVLDGIMNDGGHNVVSYYPIMELTETHPDLVLSQKLIERLSNPEDPVAPYIYNFQAPESSIRGSAYMISKIPVYQKLEVLGTWNAPQPTPEDPNAETVCAALYVYDDTGIFEFGSFNDESAKGFKEALDIAKEKGLKNILVDLTTNGGGEDTVLRYMMTLMADYGDLPPTLTVTGNKISRPTKSDKNLDGVYDEKDNAVKYDFNFGLLISDYSFSCGHILPVVAKNNNIMLIGTEKTGGGSCAVQFSYLSNGYDLRMSSILKFRDNEGNDTDLGVAPHYVIANALTNEDMAGVDMNDFSTYPTVPELYDMAKIDSLFDDYYKPKFANGDVNGDGNIDIEDAVKVINNVNGLNPLTDDEASRADIDANKKIDIEDAVAIIAHVNGVKAIV